MGLVTGFANSHFSCINKVINNIEFFYFASLVNIPLLILANLREYLLEKLQGDIVP